MVTVTWEREVEGWWFMANLGKVRTKPYLKTN
jgi:hypothetical protein